jgi:hypothetical protein
MKIPLYASESETLARQVVEALAAQAVEAAIVPAARPCPATWGLDAGTHDVVVEHKDLPRALEALASPGSAESPVAAGPIAGSPGPAGTTILRAAGGGPGWEDSLATGPRGELRLLRRADLAPGRSRDPVVLERACEDVLSELAALREVSSMTPAAITVEPTPIGDPRPGLVVVLELPDEPAASLSGAARPLEVALVALRTLQRAHESAASRGLRLTPLGPDDVLVHDDGRLMWTGAGLLALVTAVGGDPLPTPPPLEPSAALRMLLASGPAGPLPAGLSALEAYFAASRPDRGTTLEKILQELGRCGRCGTPTTAGSCPSCLQ